LELEDLLNSDSAENGDGFSSCFRTEGELLDEDPLPENPRGCDMEEEDSPSLFIEGLIRLMLEEDEWGCASKDDSFFKFKSPVVGSLLGALL
jgi:hypothetical protein